MSFSLYGNKSTFDIVVRIHPVLLWKGLHLLDTSKEKRKGNQNIGKISIWKDGIDYVSHWVLLLLLYIRLVLTTMRRRLLVMFLIELVILLNDVIIRTTTIKL